MINYQVNYYDKYCQNCCDYTLQNLTKLQNNYHFYNNTATIIEKKEEAKSKTCKKNLMMKYSIR